MIAQSQIDKAVRQLVLERMPNLSKTLQNSYFKGHGPFATFSVNIEVAYAMGKIDAAVRDDLNAIRKVRNEFAHTVKHLHFGSTEITALLLKFKDYDKKLDPFVFFKDRVDACWAAIIPQLKTDALVAALMKHGASTKKSG